MFFGAKALTHTSVHKKVKRLKIKMKKKLVLSVLFLAVAMTISLLIFNSLLNPWIQRYIRYIDRVGQVFCYGPLITSLLFVVFIKKDKIKLLAIKRFSLKAIFPVLLIPFVILFVTLIIQNMFHFVSANQSFGLFSSNYLLEIKTFFILAFFCIIYSGFGEEVGWRGYLFNKLHGMNWVSFVLILNFIWALWHIPLFYLGTYKSPSILKFIIFVIATQELGIILMYIRLKSNSVIPCAIFHGLVNGVGYFHSYFDTKDIFWGSFPSPIDILVLSPFAIYFYKKGKKLYDTNLSSSTNL